MTSRTRTAMRRTACTLVFLTLVPCALPAQRLELAPARLSAAESAPNGGWCFGMKLRPRDRCANFTLLEFYLCFGGGGD